MCNTVDSEHFLVVLISFMLFGCLHLLTKFKPLQNLTLCMPTVLCNINSKTVHVL